MRTNNNMWRKFKSNLLSVLSMTLGCLLGDDKATDRPMAKVTLQHSKVKDKFLYDSGAQVCLISKNSFRQIPIHKRPKKIDFNLVCSGVSGNNLRIKGCYLLNINIFGKDIQHPFFVVDHIPGQTGVLGIDIIKKHGLALDVITNTPYFVNTKNEATVTKDTFLPARSRQMCKIKVPKNFNKKNSEENNVVLQIDVPDCSQIFVDELLIDPNEEGYANVYLTNVSQLNMKISKDTIVGQVEAVCEKDMTPFRVSSTTPFVSTKMVEKMVVPLLSENSGFSTVPTSAIFHQT